MQSKLQILNAFHLVSDLRCLSVVSDAVAGSIGKGHAMNQRFRETWMATVLFAAVVMLALTIVIVTVVDALALEAGPDIPAYVHYQQADEALAAGDVVLALRHWREGHAVAVASRRWEGLVEAGDLYRRIGARGGFYAEAVARARDCYLTALLRARGERSLDGVLRATDAFIGLGDAPIVDRGLEIAREVAVRDADPRARQRVERLAARWAARAGRAGAGLPVEESR
jgi:hypothetical protein